MTVRRAAIATTLITTGVVMTLIVGLMAATRDASWSWKSWRAIPFGVMLAGYAFTMWAFWREALSASKPVAGPGPG